MPSSTEFTFGVHCHLYQQVEGDLHAQYTTQTRRGDERSANHEPRRHYHVLPGAFRCSYQEHGTVRIGQSPPSYQHVPSVGYTTQRVQGEEAVTIRRSE
jgi:hypothetical protein